MWRYAKRMRRLVKEIGDDDISGASSELAYRFFLALFPFFIFLAAAGGFAAKIFDVENPTGQVMDWLGDSLPPEANEVLRGQLEGVIEAQDPALLSVGIVGAIWAASAGIGSLTKALNRVFEVKETRSVFQRYATNVGLTVFGGAALVAAFVVLVVGQVAGMDLAAEFGVEGDAARLLTLARLPVVALVILTGVSVLYWLAPNVNLSFRWLTPGAAMFTILWLGASQLFGLYVSNFGSYNATYGTLGGIVVLLFWFYLTAFILLVGAELNAVVAQEAAPQLLPQTAAQGRTPETIPSQPDVTKPVGPPRRGPPGWASSRLLGVVTIVLSAGCFWRLGRHKQPSETNPEV